VLRKAGVGLSDEYKHLLKEYFCGVMAEVEMLKKIDFLFSIDMSYLNGVL
jgi:hypothetical protein